MMMTDSQIMSDILKNKAVIAEKNNFTYVNRLYPELGESPDLLLICKSIASPTRASRQSRQETSNVKEEPLEATEHDVTGSPLRHSFGEESFDVTVVDQKRNWSRDEENHFPLEKFQASSILNLCLEKLGKKWSAPLFVLCDRSDEEKTVLLGTSVETGWFSTMKVCCGGSIGSLKIQDCRSLLDEHLRLFAVPEHEVNVEISCAYEFCGQSKIAMDRTEKERANYEGYLSLELSWNALTFLPPSVTTSNYLVAEIAAGCKSSPLHDLWNELLLLDRYLRILEAYRETNFSSRYSVLPLVFPKDFFTPFIEKPERLLERLNELLEDVGIENYDDRCNNDKHIFESDKDFDDEAFLSNYLRELSTRPNLDFTDKLWRLIIGTSDYKQITDCLHTVFEDICKNRYKPQMSETQSTTRIANMINDFNVKTGAMPSLAGSLPLELVIDMGVEKITRDYKYLLLSANLADAGDIGRKLSNVSAEDFSTENYRKLLLNLARIHVCLEFLLLAQNNVDFSSPVFYSFFDHAMKLYTSSDSPVKSLADCVDNTIYTLKAPGSNAFVKQVTKTSPSTWRATLTSASRAKKLTTTTHYSLEPIFPPNIYTPDDPIDGDESFYVTNVVTSAYKIH